MDARSVEWLNSSSVTHPPLLATFRNPTPAEIESVLASFSDYTYVVRQNSGHWYAEVSWAKEPSSGPWTEITVMDFQGADVPQPFHFTKGWIEIIMLVTERLTHICGPLVMADGGNGTPYLVQPGKNLQTLIDEYNSR